MSQRSDRTIVTPFAGTLPISLDEAKEFCDETSDVRDTLIQNTLQGGFDMAERHLNRGILTQTRRWEYLRAPVYHVYIEPFDPATLTVQRAVDGAWSDLDADDYSVSPDTGEITASVEQETNYWPGRSQCFPEPEGDYVGAYAYRIEAQVGWAPASLPYDLRVAILSYVRDVYKHRGIRDIGRPETKPWAAVEHYSWRFG